MIPTESLPRSLGIPHTPQYSNAAPSANTDKILLLNQLEFGGGKIAASMQ